ncbi:conserved hypothetical protein [Candidatus Terasakiella magnetica]|uniref:SAM-dependent methyltransferase n=1 Tax=Candidatus Terasakiella magnetica TaxID=1867952 RepID=A0A1C3RIH2_9PROT|nr:DUF938 domain-containing protein [Candidatus Terasakiella magnetica]SCA57063.1 conserved hypothetical protein [Candidatus Terasakiella magnetica]
MPHRLFYPATQRNRDAIFSILKQFLPQQGNVLEIASGSGEHVIHFAQSCPDLNWQPSDLDPDCLKSIQSWIEHTGLKNIHSPLSLDTTSNANWPQTELDALICINMIHISPWEATIALMKKAAHYLKEDGFLYLYGPYKRNSQHTAPSNVAFEQWLKEKDPRFGVRAMEEVEAEAAKNGLKLAHVYDMPANNFSLVFHPA